MKKWIYILGLTFFFSCSNREPRNVESSESHDLLETTSISKEDAFTGIAKQRLQDRLDGLRLKESHPDFDLTLLEDNIFKGKEYSQAVLQNVKILSQQNKAGITFFKLELTLTTTKGSLKDTIGAKIVSEEILIDGELVSSTKIGFELLPN